MSNTNDFVIENGVLTKYVGSDEHVVVPDGVTEIDSFVFSNGIFESVVLPEGLKKIGHNAFDGCNNLKTINIPDSVEEIGYGVFFFCQHLVDSNGYIIIQGILFGVEWDMDFDLTDSFAKHMIPEGVTRICEGTFMEFEEITSIIIPNDVISIDKECFLDCCDLKSVTIPESVKKIGENAFGGCPLDELYAPGAPLTSIEGTKMKALAVKTFVRSPERYTNEIVIASYHKYLITQKRKWLPVVFKDDRVDLLQIYADAKKITAENLDEEYLKPAMEANATQCTAYLLELKNRLTKGIKPKAEKDKLSEDPFSEKFIKKLWSFKERKDGTIELTDYKGTETNVYVPVRIGEKPVTKLGDYLFSPEKPRRRKAVADVMNRITNVELPDCLEEIGEYAFSKCEKLAMVSLPESIKKIGLNAFYFCTALKSVIIPDGITCIEMFTFYYCIGLTNVVLPKKLTKIDYEAFSGCGKLKDIILPESLTSIGEGAFSYCESLKNVNIHNNITNIGKGAFRGCKALADINGFVIHKGILYYYAGSEASLEVPTDVTTIDGWAFARCVGLKSVSLPYSLTYIGAFAFYECKNLKNIFMPQSLEFIDNHAFQKCPKTTIHAPAGSYAEQYAKEHNIPFVAE